MNQKYELRKYKMLKNCLMYTFLSFILKTLIYVIVYEFCIYNIQQNKNISYLISKRNILMLCILKNVPYIKRMHKRKLQS